MWPRRGRTGWLTDTNAEDGQGRKFGRYPFRGVQNPLPDWSPQSRQARRSYLFHAGDPLHSSGHPHGALRRTSLACASEASHKVPADWLGSGTGSPRFQRSIYLEWGRAADNCLPVELLPGIVLLTGNAGRKAAVCFLLSYRMNNVKMCLKDPY